MYEPAQHAADLRADLFDAYCDDHFAFFNMIAYLPDILHMSLGRSAKQALVSAAHHQTKHACFGDGAAVSDEPAERMPAHRFDHAMYLIRRGKARVIANTRGAMSFEVPE